MTPRLPIRLRQVLGSLRILSRRSREVGRPGLATWADAGEAAALAVAVIVRDTAHRAELRSLSLADELDVMLADGVIDLDEQRRLTLAPARVRQIAADCHDISEVAS